MPSVQSTFLPFGGGLDLVSAPGQAAPGTCKFAKNFEQEADGGYRRVRGFERYSGRPSPSQAGYTAVFSSTGFSGVTVGQTVNGATSGATARVVMVTANLLGLGRVVGDFANEVLRVGVTPVGTITNDEPLIEGFQDNELAQAAADDLRADIVKPPGTAVRGVAILNDQVFCWVDNAGALQTYRATVGGWVLVPLLWTLTFTGGSSEYSDGEVVTQGAASATVRRAVVESGDWLAGTAAGRLIVSPISGSFAAGISGGGGVATLAGPATQISQFAGGRVRSVVYNFTAALSTRRLYCCDGVNQEWEFDGTVIVPINTKMAGIRATAVAAHKNHLFFAYRSSAQHSQPGLPYQWSGVLGAAELGIGDTITNMINVAGSETSAALMLIGENSANVLYGSGVADWDLRRISDEAGAQRDSALEFGGVLAFDSVGARRFRPTQSFGNFSNELVTNKVAPLVRGAIVNCSVLAKNDSLYRVFMNDGLVLSAGQWSRGSLSWMVLDYGRTITHAVGGEINGVWRVFMADSAGWVLEADVGRSFDGGAIEAGIRMSSQNQGNGLTNKMYRTLELSTVSESAFSLAVAGEFDDGDPSAADVLATQLSAYQRQYGAGLLWDFGSWDRAYWDAGSVGRLRYPLKAVGRSVSVLAQHESTNQMSFTLKGATYTYTQRRLVR